MKTELNGNFRMSLKQYLGGNFIALNTVLEKMKGWSMTSAPTLRN